MNKQMTFEEKLASGYFIRKKVKPVAVLSAPVSEALAKVAAENPEGVRISATRKSGGLSVFERPQSNPNNVTVRTDLVYEVDADGRPVWDEVGVVSDYHPWSGLRR